MSSIADVSHMPNCKIYQDADEVKQVCLHRVPGIVPSGPAVS